MTASAQIFVTRTPAAAGELIDELLEGVGKSLLSSPSGAIELFCVPLHEAELIPQNAREVAHELLRQSLEGQFDAVTFTSRNGVRAFEQLIASQALPFPPETLIAAVGQGTAAELKKLGITANFIPDIQDAQHMIQQWPASAGSNQRILCVQGANARPTLRQGLKALGHRVDVATVYQMRDFPAESALVPGSKSYDEYEPLSLTQALEVAQGRASADSSTPRILIATAPSLLQAFYQGWVTSLQGSRENFPHLIAIGKSTDRQAVELGLTATVPASPAAPDLATAVCDTLLHLTR